MKTIPCPTCGSTNIGRQRNTLTGACTNLKGCERRRCERRQAEDKKLWRDKPWVQCHGTTSGGTVLFCTLGKGHKDPHLHGTREWGGSYEAPIAKALRAGLA